MDCCCSGGEVAAKPRRVVAVVQWGLPVAALALMPKCPVCFAGYVMMFTGIGLSFSTAAMAREAAIGGCVAAIGFLVVRMGWRLWMGER